MPTSADGEPEAEQVAGVVGAVADRRGDAAGDGDDERDDRRAGTARVLGPRLRPLARRSRRSRDLAPCSSSSARFDGRVAALVGRADPAGQGDQRQQREQPRGEALGDRPGAAEVVGRRRALRPWSSTM